MNFIKTFIILATVTTAKGSFQNDIEIEKVKPGFIRENLGKGIAIGDYLDIIFKYNLTSFNMDHISNINLTFHDMCVKYKEHFNRNLDNCDSHNTLSRKIEKVIKKYKILMSNNKKYDVDENVLGQKRDKSAAVFGASIEQNIKISQSSETQQKIMQEKNQHLKIIDQYLFNIINIEKVFEDKDNLLKEMHKNFNSFEKISKYSLSLLGFEENIARFYYQLLELVEDTLESIENLIEIIQRCKNGDFSVNLFTDSELKNLLASIKLREGTSLPFEINKINFDLVISLFKFQVTYVKNVFYVSMLIPLKDKNSNDFDLQRIFSIPMIENDTLTYIIPSSNYIFVNEDLGTFSPVDVKKNCDIYNGIYYCENVDKTFKQKDACFLNEVKVSSHCKFEKSLFNGFKSEILPMENALLVITNTEKTLTTEEIHTRKKGSIKLTKGSHILRSKSFMKLNFKGAYFKFGVNIILNITFDKPYVSIPKNISSMNLHFADEEINYYEIKSEENVKEMASYMKEFKSFIEKAKEFHHANYSIENIITEVIYQLILAILGSYFTLFIYYKIKNFFIN
ncbi:hypothetical protein PVAND_000870 [Polypedilum vanderplanki]|uniref:Envelope fusion protein n=1 Tax=Polypedilum vanderplanki TaxID=319348 RepID=A0A9J6BLI5_POLVA|nr:hypothetical protein PVAND_000870 [Polypedilum vanderplanki]